MIAPWSVGMGPIKQCFFVPTMFVLTNAPVLHMIEMECKNYEIRVLLRFFWKKGLRARAAAKEICEVEGQGTVGTLKARNRYLLSLFGLYE
jgi:hypothetical protein